VRVTGAGAGGWRIAQNANQFIASHNFTIPDQWTPRDSNREWRSVASSADGTKLVAVAYLHQIQTSAIPARRGRRARTSEAGKRSPRQPTARSWSPLSAADEFIPRLIRARRGRARRTSNMESGRFVSRRHKAGCRRRKLGQIYTSTDSGVTWTPRESVGFGLRLRRQPTAPSSSLLNKADESTLRLIRRDLDAARERENLVWGGFVRRRHKARCGCFQRDKFIPRPTRRDVDAARDQSNMELGRFISRRHKTRCRAIRRAYLRFG
jgi:hypothetical protein